MYIVYDIEATGLEKGYAQILQLAFAFADDHFNILDAQNFKAKKLPWVIPSPEALLITRITPQELKKQKFSHYEMMHEVVKWLKARPFPITYLTYNGHGFDIEQLEHALVQTLHDKNIVTGFDNTHMDIYRVAQAVSVLAPDAIDFSAKNKSGLPSLGLGTLARQNGIGLSEHEAHDALNDVKATLALAKLFQAKAPELWNALLETSSRQKTVHTLNKNDAFLFCKYEYGRTQNYYGAIFPDITIFDQAIMIDVTGDIERFMKKSENELYQILKVYGRKKDDQPLQYVDLGKQPILLPLDTVKHQHHLSVTELEARARLVKTNADFKAKIAKVAARLEAEMSQALNQQKDLEQSALSPMLNETASQKKWRADFNAASTWDERLRLMQHLKKSFNDKSKKNPDIINYQFSQRLLFAEAKEQMHADVLAQFNLAVAKRVLNDDANAPYMTIPKAKRILDEVAQKRDAGDAKFKDVTDQELRVLKLYYTSLEKEFLAYLKPNMSVPPNSL